MGLGRLGERRAVACLLVAVTGVWDLLDHANHLFVGNFAKAAEDAVAANVKCLARNNKSRTEAYAIKSR
jgi:hypothetical protein